VTNLVQPSPFPPPETWPVNPQRAKVVAPLRLADFPLLPKRADGWYFATPFEGWPEAGPYATRAEADQARKSFVRNWVGNFKRPQILPSESRVSRQRRTSKRRST
jgi:hypothetical protein